MQAIDNNLSFLVKETDIIIDWFESQENLNDIDFFSLLMIERLNVSASGLQLLTKEILAKSKLEYSCGIIIRATLLDFLIVLNGVNILHSETKKDSARYEELTEFCKMMLYDSVNRLVNDVSVLGLTKEEQQIVYSNVVNKYTALFEPYEHDGSKPKTKFQKRAPSGTDLYKRVFANQELRGLAKIYQPYLIYSKYDHFGLMYYFFGREPFIKQVEWMDKCISLFPKMLIFLLSILYSYHNSEFLKGKLSEAFQFDADNNKQQLKGKSVFTADEISELKKLIKERVAADSSAQKNIRNQMRKIGFYGKEDWGIYDCQLTDLDFLISLGLIQVR